MLVNLAGPIIRVRAGLAVCLTMAVWLCQSCGLPREKISIPPVPTPSPSQRDQSSPDRLDMPLPDVSPSGFVAPPNGVGIARYTNQTVIWKDCVLIEARGQCASLAVPLDYDSPDTQAITLSLFKLPARVEPRLGTLFVNPGGPGESGRDFAAWGDWEALAGFDIVGWDPRGTVGSTPVDCGDPADIDRLLELDDKPETPEAKQSLLDGWKQFGLSCLEYSGALLAHISTQETVYDLEILRTLLGDDQLNYLGYSYGTLIGALYAETYPDKVGRMVLDSPVNLSGDDSIPQLVGFDQAFLAYTDWCAQNDCGLGLNQEIVQRRIVALLDRLGEHPVKVGKRQLTQSLAVYGIMGFLYFDESAWNHLTAAIIDAETGTGRYLLESSDLVWGRDKAGTYATFPAFHAISCLDTPDDGIAGAEARWRSQQQNTGILGSYFGMDASCVQWPVPARVLPTIRAQGAGPILVVGATGDSATPYAYAPWMADQLDSAVLVTYDGAGHGTSFNDRSPCVDQAVVDYLTEVRVPPHGLYCT